MIKASRPITKGISPRPRLFARLDNLFSTSAALWVSSNAGSGKTALISSYLAYRGVPSLWLPLEREDADLGEFFYSVSEAARHCSFTPPAALPLLLPEYCQAIPRFSRRFFAELFNLLPLPFIFVFDNYQQIADDSPLHMVMMHMLTRLPEGVQAIIISRYDPPDAFIRLRANRQLSLLPWEDIRLTLEEAVEMFSLHEDNPPVELIRRFHAVCDGWAAGLMLMMHVAQKDPTNTSHVAPCSHEQIFTYFSQEVFGSLDATMRAFMIKTALLSRTSASMAAELTACDDAEDRLQILQRTNLFISRTAETIYEYHPLFRDFLLTRAQQELSTDQIFSLQSHAAELLLQVDQVEAAVELLEKSAHWQRIGEVVITHAPILIKQGRHHVLLSWLQSIPQTVRANQPWLLYWHGMCLLPQHPHDAQACFEHAYSRFQEQEHFDPTGALLATSGVINAIVACQEDFTPLGAWIAVLDDLTQQFPACSFGSDEAGAWVIASMAIAVSLFESPHAETWKERVLELPETVDTINPKMHALFHLFWFQGVNRGMHGLYPLYQELQRLTCSLAATPYAQLVAKICEIQYFEATALHGECLQAVEETLEYAELQGILLYQTTLHFLAIACYLDRMDCASAEKRLEQMQPYLATAKPWAAASMHHQFTRLALMRKEYHQALYHAEQAFHLGSGLGSPFILGCSHWMMAQVCHRLERFSEAQEHLGQCCAVAERHDCRWARVMVLLYDAQFALDRDNEQQGLESLRSCFALARQGGYLLTCLDDPTVTVRMCVKALEEDIEVDHVQTIIRRRGLIPESPPVHLEHWPWPIRIYTLGRFSLVRDGKPLEPGRKAQQMPLRLLKLLIALGGREVAEERLSDILWPESDGDMAHHAFETTLMRLRKLLGIPEALRFREGKLSLDHRFCWVDCWAFERLLGQVEALTHQQDGGRAASLFTRAIKLFQGDFLSREEEETWRLSCAERLRQKFLQAVLLLCVLLESMGHWAELADIYQRCIAIDIGNAEWFRRLKPALGIVLERIKRM